MFERVSLPESETDPPWRVTVRPDVEQDESPLRVVTRLSTDDDSCSISAYAESSLVCRSTLGNPIMGSSHHVDFVKVAQEGWGETRHDLGEGGMIWLSLRVK